MHMLQFSCEKTLLQSAVNTASRTVAAKSSIPALEGLLRKYPGNEIVEAFVADNRHEVELYLEYQQHYGYVFYLGRKR